MTEFADNAAAIRMNPVIKRYGAGIDARVDHHGLTTARKELADLLAKRSKPAIETHHHERCATRIQQLSVSLLQLRQLFTIDGERLFDEYRLAFFQSLDRVSGVHIMASEDESGVDIRIAEQLGRLLRGFKLESAPGRGCAGARDGADGLKAHALDRLESRKNHA